MTKTYNIFQIGNKYTLKLTTLETLVWGESKPITVGVYVSEYITYGANFMYGIGAISIYTAPKHYDEFTLERILQELNS